MGNCRDCRFWSQTLNATWDERWASGVGGDMAYCLVTMSGSAVCSPDLVNPLGDRSLAWAYGDEGWLEVLVTQPDFGCVQFKAKT